MTALATPVAEHRGSHVAEPLRSRRDNWNNQVRRHAHMRPDATALRWMGRSLSWAALHARSEQLADALARRGVGAGDRVLLLMLNRPEFLESVLAVNALGAIAVPVNFRMAPPEVAYLVADSGAAVVVTDSPLAPLVAAVRQHAPELSTAVVVATAGAPSAGGTLDYESLLAEGGERHEPVDVPDDAPALIMYTSGTTGRPKGAVLTHANMQAQALTCIWSMQMIEGDVGFCASPMFHIAALGSMAPSIKLGVPTVVYPTGEFDPAKLLDTVAAEGVTILFLVPVQWQVVCAMQAAQPRELALRVISWGAAPATDTILKAMAATFPQALNLAVFGQTEMSPITCVLQGRDALRKLGSVGTVIPTVEARVVDADMSDVAPGEVGEIVYRGPTLMAGYWRKPEATADAFEGGWFHSGDLVRVDEEGFVHVVDRKKDMIISGGENIYCAEVENVLASHPGIVDVAVIGRPDDRWGETVVAVAVPAPGAEVNLAALEPWLNEHLARYKHPKELLLVDALPRNASGKIVKGQLRQQHGQLA